MQELRFVAVSEDGSYAVLAVPGRSARFVLPIDERLRAVALGQTSRLAQYEIEVESPLRPKEIQARIRAGETAEEIADAAGIPVERVRWFEGPVLAERAYIAQQAQTATVRRHGDSAGPGPHLQDIVAERMTASGVDPEEGEWDSRKRGDGSWQVQLTYSAAGRLHIAEWMFDPRRRHVMPEDDTAARLSLPESELPPLPEPMPGEATVTPIASRLGAAAGMGGGMSPAPAVGRRPGAPDRPPVGAPVGDRPPANRPAAYAQPPVTPRQTPYNHDSERIVPSPPAPPSSDRRPGAPWSDSARRAPDPSAYRSGDYAPREGRQPDGYQPGDYQPGDYQFDAYDPRDYRRESYPSPPAPDRDFPRPPAASEPPAAARPPEREPASAPAPEAAPAPAAETPATEAAPAPEAAPAAGAVSAPEAAHAAEAVPAPEAAPAAATAAATEAARVPEPTRPPVPARAASPVRETSRAAGPAAKQTPATEALPADEAAHATEAATPAAKAPAAEAARAAQAAPHREAAATAEPAAEQGPAAEPAAPGDPAPASERAVEAESPAPAAKKAAAKKEPAPATATKGEAVKDTSAKDAATKDRAAKDSAAKDAASKKKAGEKEPAAEEQPARPRTARKNPRARRSSVPSWDEIMLGSSRQRD